MRTEQQSLGVVAGLPILVALSVVGAAGCGGAKTPPAGEREVRVAVAANFKFAFDDLRAAFQEKNPGIKVRATYGSSGNFFAQLSGKAPFDLFLSADAAYPRRLIENGLADHHSEFLYAVGRIVVWVPNASKLDVEKLGIKAAADPSVKKIAIANPRLAPYGQAAEAALKNSGVYGAVADRLVVGENIAQTSQFVESGAADMGILALSLAVAPAMKGKGRYGIVPLDAYPRIEQHGVILKWAKDREATHSLRSFMTGPEGRTILQRYGYALPGG